MKTVIIGNGIVATSIAFRLAKSSQANDEIVVVGNNSRVGAATLAAPAMLNSFAEIEKGSLESDIDLYRFKLSREATDVWPAFEKEVNQQAFPDKHTKMEGFSTGTYVINNTAADDLDDESFDAIAEACVRFNEKFSFVSPKDIPNYMPEQRHRATRALLIENEGWVNPIFFLNKLDTALGRFSNVKFINQNVTKLNEYNAKVHSIALSDGTNLQGDRFVLATGASVTELLTASEIALDCPRVFYGVGVSLEIKSPDFPHSHCVRTPNRGLACGLYTAPYATSEDYPKDHVIIGASNFISPTSYFNGRLTSVEGLVRGAIEQINHNFYRADFIKTNVGWRPTSQDTYPMMGKTSINNLTIVTATKREGFHLCPVISDRIVKILHGQQIEKEFEMFKPERKIIKSLTREAAISKAVRHQISAAYQHGFNPSKSRMPDQLRAMYKDDLERLHDKIGAYDWGIPPEMLDMYRYGHASA